MSYVISWESIDLELLHQFYKALLDLLLGMVQSMLDSVVFTFWALPSGSGPARQREYLIIQDPKDIDFVSYLREATS